MTWVRLEAEFYRHPKVRKLGDGAFRAFMEALCYSNDLLLDGQIERGVARSFGWTKRASELVEGGMWEPTDGGWLIHDWDKYQPSRARVLEQQEHARIRMGRVRGNSAAGSPDVRANTERTSRASVSESDPPLPNPTDSDRQTRARHKPVDDEFIGVLVAEFGVSEANVRRELATAMNRRQWDDYKDKRRHFHDWMERAAGGGARAQGGGAGQSTAGARGVAAFGARSGPIVGAFPVAKQWPDAEIGRSDAG